MMLSELAALEHLSGPGDPGRQWMDAYVAIRGTNVRKDMLLT